MNKGYAKFGAGAGGIRCQDDLNDWSFGTLLVSCRF